MGVADTLPASLEDAKFYRLLSCSFPQTLVADDVWPVYLKNSSETDVNESLDSFRSGDGGSPCFGKKEQTRFTMVLKILILVLVPRSDDLQTFFSCWKGALALPMRALASAFVRPVLSTVLLR